MEIPEVYGHVIISHVSKVTPWPPYSDPFSLQKKKTMKRINDMGLQVMQNVSNSDIHYISKLTPAFYQKETAFLAADMSSCMICQTNIFQRVKIVVCRTLFPTQA